MRILRSRETLRFVLLLVQCTCGRRFGHREDRRTVVCFHCGRVADLGKVQMNDVARRRLVDRRRKMRRLRVVEGARVTARRANTRG
jgi:hypothetical protein